ncbi:MAG: hypothetical protein Q8P18_27530 [Pseudomonadota bacterium]|nr:hypothetical protein [Pseudomonadota bacterium]
MLLLLACTAPPAGPDTAELDTGGESPALSVLYLSGESQYYDVDGVPVGRASKQLLRRTVDPASATLEERVLEKSAGAVEEFTITAEIDPAGPTWTFGFDTGDGRIEGNGTFDEGETWEWTAWHSTSTLVGGSSDGWTILSEDRLDGDTFTAHKAFSDATGAAQGTTEEILAVIDQETWDVAAAEW